MGWGGGGGGGGCVGERGDRLASARRTKPATGTLGTDAEMLTSLLWH